MSLKGKIEPDHIPRNLPHFHIIGDNKEIVVLNVSEIEETIQNVMLPDRTQASGGQSEPVSFTIQIPAHHDSDVEYMNKWFEDSRRPDVPGRSGYKKQVRLDHKRLSDGRGRSLRLEGVFPTGRNIDEKDMDNEGEMMRITYTISADEVKSIT